MDLERFIAQQDLLLQPPAPASLSDKDGFTYVGHQFIRVSLTRVFGFGGWEFWTEDSVCLKEELRAGKRDQWFVTYRVRGVLTVRFADGSAPSFSEYSANESNHPQYDQAHDNAVKGASSNALRRCAMNLGSVFGLGLYFSDPAHPGRKSAMKGEVVRYTVDMPEKGAVRDAEAPSTPAVGDPTPEVGRPVREDPGASNDHMRKAVEDLKRISNGEHRLGQGGNDA